MLSGLIGLSMIAVPLRAIAATHSDGSSIAEPAWQQAHTPTVTLARDHDEDEEHEHHGHGWKHDRDDNEEYGEHHQGWRPTERHDADDYNWGGRYRYNYPP